ncbi:MAG: Ig-like domain repeat protein, partial [Mycobacterium sp.]|nr:Ig-like domain repeat protein [Mycobacterium sp.]
MRHKGKFLLPVLAAGVLGATLLPAGMAAADTIGNSLPITSFSQLAVDSLHQHLFFRQTDSIVVTDFTGKQVTAISGLSSLDYIVVSPDSSTLYALGSDGSVHVYSTATLTQTTTYALPAGDVPSALAVQSGKLWVSYNDNNVTGTSDIGALGYFDLTASATSPVFTGDALPGTWYRAPEITADPSNSGVLLAYTGEQSAQVITYDTVNDQVIAQQRILVTDGSNISDASMLPGGRQFILSLIQGNAVLYNSSDLSQAATYANTNPFPESLAVAPTGAVAVGQLLSEDPNELDPDVAVFQPGITNSVFNTYNAAGSLALAVAPHGLAWSADGSRLFTVEGSSGSTADYRLDVLDDPSKIHSTLTLTGPSRVIVGPDATATLTGRLTLSNNAAMPSDAAVTVTRTAPDGTVSSLPAPAIGSDGSFSATDAGPITGTGTYTYTVSYTDASGAITPSTSSFAVSAEKYGAVLQLHGPASTALTYGQGVSFTGNLSLGDNGNADSGNKTITITRSGTSAKTFTATTASDGSFTFSDPPLPIGHYTYTASYAGDASTNAATAAITVSVAQRQPTLTIGANVAKAAYGQKITVTATLGPTFAD